MLDQLSLETFRPHVGQPFAVRVGKDRFLPVHLVEARPLAMDGDTRRKREPFALVFLGPGGGHIPQDIYRVESAVTEPMEIFLVPLGPHGDGMLYEAVFT